MQSHETQIAPRGQQFPGAPGNFSTRGAILFSCDCVHFVALASAYDRRTHFAATTFFDPISFERIGLLKKAPGGRRGRKFRPVVCCRVVSGISFRHRAAGRAPGSISGTWPRGGFRRSRYRCLPRHRGIPRYCGLPRHRGTPRYRDTPPWLCGVYPDTADVGVHPSC